MLPEALLDDVETIIKIVIGVNCEYGIYHFHGHYPEHHVYVFAVESKEIPEAVMRAKFRGRRELHPSFDRCDISYGSKMYILVTTTEHACKWQGGRYTKLF